MSVERIESAYAHCRYREDIDGTAMAVLTALAFCENKKTGNCFPSVNYVSELSHFKRTAVVKACKRLKKAGLISWTPGGRSKQGNVSNHYTFSFGYKKLSTRYEHYVSISKDLSSDKCNVTDTTVRQTDTPSVPDALPPYAKRTHLVRQTDSNSENKPKNNSENNAEVSATPPMKSSFQSICQTVVHEMKQQQGDEKDITQVIEELAEEAMKICGVSGDDEKEKFISAIRVRNLEKIQEELYTFQSEVRQGEHKNALNLAAVLMSKIKKLPRNKIVVFKYS